jgi:hypothetical protein
MRHAIGPMAKTPQQRGEAEECCFAVMDIPDWTQYVATQGIFYSTSVPLLRHLNATDVAPKTAGAVVPSHSMHSLLGELCASSTDSLLMFGRKLFAHPVGELAFIAQHVYDRQTLLPATAYLEMAIAAAMVGLGRRGVAMSAKHRIILENVSFLRPMMFSPTSGASREVRSVLEFSVSTSQAGSSFQGSFRVSSHLQGAENQSTTHCHCVIRLLEMDDGLGAPLSSSDADAEIARVSIDQLFEDLETGGFEYGPMFRDCICSLQTRPSGERIMELVPTQDHRDSSFWLHPALLDACTQVASVLGHPSIPRSVDRITILTNQICSSRLSQKHMLRSLFQTSSNGASSIQVSSADSMLVVMEGFFMSPAPVHRTPESACATEWVKFQPRLRNEAVAIESKSSLKWVVVPLDTIGKATQAMADRLQAQVIAAKAVDDDYGLDDYSVEGVVVCAADLSEMGSAGTVSAIVHGLERLSVYARRWADWLRRKLAAHGRLWIVVQGVASCGSSDELHGVISRHVQAACSGLCIALRREIPHVALSTIDILDLLPRTIDLVVDLLHSPWTAADSAIRHESVYAPQFVVSSIEASAAQPKSEGKVDATLKPARLESQLDPSALESRANYIVTIAPEAGLDGISVEPSLRR